MKETTTIARPLSFASNTTETPPVVARAASAEKTSVNAYDDEKIHKRFKSFFVQLTNKKKEKKKEKNAQISRFRSVKHKHTCDIHKRSHLSLSLSFFPSVRANGEEKKKESEGRRRNIEKEKVPR